MILIVGQRWRYKSGGFDFLVEIIENNQIKTQILQSNSYSISQGYTVGKITNGDGVSNVNYQGNEWQYLEGQDKPK